MLFIIPEHPLSELEDRPMAGFLYLPVCFNPRLHAVRVRCKSFDLPTTSLLALATLSTCSSTFHFVRGFLPFVFLLDHSVFTSPLGFGLVTRGLRIPSIVVYGQPMAELVHFLVVSTRRYVLPPTEHNTVA